MNYSTVTIKGQVTIPAQYRRRLNLKPKSKVKFLLKDSGDLLVQPVRRSIVDYFDLGKKYDLPQVDLDKERELAQDAYVRS